MTTVWITHGDSDDYYGIAEIKGVHATLELAKAAAEAAANAEERTVRLEWRDNKLIRHFRHGWANERDTPYERVEAEITGHTIEGA